MSFENPYQSPTTVSESSSVADPDRLRRLASAQRRVNLAVLMYLAMIFVNGAINVASRGQTWGAIVLLTIVVAVLSYGAVAVFTLASMFRGRAVAVIYVLGLLVPLLGLLLLLSINSKATKELKANGIRVGLLGADPKTL